MSLSLNSLNSLQKAITKLKQTENISNDMKAFLVLGKYLDGNLSYREAMQILTTEDMPYHALVSALVIMNEKEI